MIPVLDSKNLFWIRIQKEHFSFCSLGSGLWMNFTKSYSKLLMISVNLQIIG